MSKRLISTFLSLVFLLNIGSATVFGVSSSILNNSNDGSLGEKENPPLLDESLFIIDSNGTDPSFSISLSEQDAKGEFNAEVYINNNPGIATFTLRLHFDKEKITPVSLSEGEALTVGNITTNMKDGSGNYLSALELSAFDYVTAGWVNTTNMMGNGIIYTVKFKVKPYQSGDTNLYLTYEAGNVANQQLEDVNFETLDDDIQLKEVTVYTIMSTINLTKSSSSLSGNVDFNIFSNNDEQHEAIVLLGIYDMNGRMVYLSSQDITLNSGDNAGSFNGINVENITDEEYTVKVFCWDSFETIEPLAQPWEDNV